MRQKATTCLSRPQHLMSAAGRSVLLFESGMLAQPMVMLSLCLTLWARGCIARRSEELLDLAQGVGAWVMVSPALSEAVQLYGFHLLVR